MENGGEMMKKIKGSQKTEINHFYKDKNGILEKANKMKSLCDAVVDLIIYSSSGKGYYYGDFLLKKIKIVFSNEQQPQGSIHFLGLQHMEGMSKMDMRNLIKKNDSLGIDLMLKKNVPKLFLEF
ncbi:hypothetical protein Ahy_A07g031883 [Arachis hypogaea]|uniref:MADS-box domain-containing protein n=1 Tax=Arachis hypogaea TaxID=3818 RepID=A0A445C5E9_ARAHY|nr:hypothetical protein Ahy_A07g031883 [Arachis hypogaea]